MKEEALPEKEERGGGRHHGRHRGHGHRGDHRGEHGQEGGGEGRISAQTFRRGRAVAFLQQLTVKQDALRKQLNDPDLAAVREVVSGELKAVDEILHQFVLAFDLYDMRPRDET
ncbi:hypothetical protein ACFPPD_17280 [Cohnella suwonensis]|uniref:Uncharacterized protein n=1 Tax=Cohnella suwonensis TaxID=696072 RepID=A0ABW0LX92_9BACL